MTDIAVVILIGQEKIHLKRCIEKLAPLEPKQIFLVESQPDDGGIAIAKETAEKFGLNLQSVFHKWPGNQAVQFNWALDNLPITGKWILRLDADEYLYPETCEEVMALLPTLDDSISSLSLSLARCIFGGKIKHGNPEIELVRFFRYGYGRSEAAEMDEHIVTSKGENLKLRGKFVDDSLLPFNEWQEKHRGYAKREAKMAVEGRANKNKQLYYRLPPYLRAFAYFCVRYFLKCGFLDGLPGFRWHFWQGLWYRSLVDYEIGKAKKRLRS